MKLNGLLFTKNRGVSIMEVLTAVVILSILSSISYAAWRNYIKKAITAEAKVNLSMIFASQTQYQATCNTYHPDLRTIGALPKGKLYYNMGGTPDSSITDWGQCLTEQDITCSGCQTYFDEVCCSKADFEDFSNESCNCYIKSDYKIDRSGMTGSSHTSLTYCGSDFSNGSILKNKFCIVAATAINRNITNDVEWDVWVVNHLNIVKQVYYPGD